MAKRFFLFFYLSMLGLLVGATVPSIPSIRPLVSQVDVYCRLDGETAHMHLTTAKEMESVLGCVRASHSHSPAPQQLPSAQGDSCVIRVQLTNGKCHLYRQHSSEFFAHDSDIWKEINPKQGDRLFALLRTLKTMGFQGAFLVFSQIASIIPKQGKKIDKCAKKHPLAFV